MPCWSLVLGGLLVAVLALAARFAADADPLERVARLRHCSAVEALVSVAAVVVLGCWASGTCRFVLPAAALPLLVVATVAVLAATHEAERDRNSRYNDGHG